MSGTVGPIQESPTRPWNFADVPSLAPEGPKRIADIPPQCKREIGSVSGQLEHEADNVAELVTRMPSDSIPVGEPLRRPPATAARALLGGRAGQPLDAETRAFMEPRFGHDFSQVRVHSDVEAETSAESLKALAYTVGSDVVFAKGQYSPASSAGRRLLAHELCHVVQQSGGVDPHVTGRTPSVLVQRKPNTSALPGQSPDVSSSPTGNVETAHRPNFRIQIVAHASPRWRGATDAVEAGRLNFALSLKRAEAVRSVVEQLVARHFPEGVSVAYEVNIDEQEGTVGTVAEARGSQDTLREARGNRSDNEQMRRRVDVIVDSSQKIEGMAGAGRRPIMIMRSTKSSFWHVDVKLTAGGSFGIGGTLIELMLINDNTHEEMFGHVFAGSLGPKAKLGAAYSVWGSPTAFSTDKEVDFVDFDGRGVVYTSAGISAFIGYSLASISFLGMGERAENINVSGASVGTPGFGAEEAVGRLTLEGTFPAKERLRAGPDVTMIPYERTDRGEDKFTVLFETGRADLGDAGKGVGDIKDPRVARLDSFLTSVIAARL